MKEKLLYYWQYILKHHWTKDILRANILYIVLTIIFNLFHFNLQPIHFGMFFRILILLNICQFFKALLDYYNI